MENFYPGFPKDSANFHEGRSMVLFKFHFHIFLPANSEIRHNLGYLLCYLFFLLRNQFPIQICKSMIPSIQMNYF